ncbi:Ubiquitin-like domain-containing CTD phosphatase 1 [Allomyces javanicus]|nr:Ubiquitin-like domain-containing CTD phosphatase 1 [Allomyces javanicus]
MMVSASAHAQPRPTTLDFTVQNSTAHPIHVVLVRAPAAVPPPDPDTLVLHLPTARVGDLKAALASATNTSWAAFCRLRLAHNGQFPADDTKLVDLGVENGTTLHLVTAINVADARAMLGEEAAVDEPDGVQVRADRDGVDRGAPTYLITSMNVSDARAMMGKEGVVEVVMDRGKARADHHDRGTTMRRGATMSVAHTRAMMEVEGLVEDPTAHTHDEDQDGTGRDDEDGDEVGPDLARMPRVLDLLERHTRMVRFLSREDSQTINVYDDHVQADIHLLHAPRPGKRLLVLDLDHTLFDCRARGVPNRADLLRPGTHEMLTTLYPHYDLVVWSQTVRAALETKLAGIGLLTNPGYRIAFVLDRSAMIELALPDWDAPHPVKPLAVIWARFPGVYTPRNTLHVDDVRRNFVLNPRNGIKVAPWYVGKTAKTVDHTRWRKAAV